MGSTHHICGVFFRMLMKNANNYNYNSRCAEDKNLFPVLTLDS